jgi:DNA-binding NarL/FixJ family response regulator
MARFLVVDDHAFARKFIRDLIEGESGWEVCGEAVDGQEAVEQFKLLKPDLIILDIQMPLMNGFQATREILLVAPKMKVLIISFEESTHFSRAAEQAGAQGYVSKSEAAGNLIPAVNALLTNGTYFSHGSPPKA